MVASGALKQSSLVSKVLSQLSQATLAAPPKIPPTNRFAQAPLATPKLSKSTLTPWLSPTKKLLQVFFKTHDPTTLNRQGGDIGTQYRSAIFYNSDEQKQTAQKVKQQLDKSEEFSSPIVTEITQLQKLYPDLDVNTFFYEAFVEFFNFGVYVDAAVGLILVVGVVIVVIVFGWIKLLKLGDFGDDGTTEFF